jgi:hypothetical protein
VIQGSFHCKGYNIFPWQIPVLEPTTVSYVDRLSSRNTRKSARGNPLEANNRIQSWGEVDPRLIHGCRKVGTVMPLLLFAKAAQPDRINLILMANSNLKAHRHAVMGAQRYMSP